jgi:Fic family protein
MTYLKNDAEYLTGREMRIYEAVCVLAERGRSVNTRQVSAATGLSPATANTELAHLQARGYVTDVGTGSAYHWRPTDKIPEQEPITAGERS